MVFDYEKYTEVDYFLPGLCGLRTDRLLSTIYNHSLTEGAKGNARTTNTRTRNVCQKTESQILVYEYDEIYIFTALHIK